MINNVEVVVYDKVGLKDTYLLKQDEVKQQKFSEGGKYFKQYKYEQPKEELDEIFEQANDISYNPEYFRENLEI